jgi:hypothetical protein
MAIATDAILRVVANLAFPESVVAQNIFYAVFSNDGTSADEEDVVEDLAVWIEDFYQAIVTYLVNDVSLTGITVYVLDEAELDWDEVGDFTLSVTGTDGTDYLAHGTAALMHANTVNPDVRGSKYVGLFGEGSNLDGGLTTAAGTALSNAFLAWVTAFTGAQTGSEFVPGVWSPTKSGFFSTNGNGFLNTFWAYQRRRKPGVGI